MILYMGYEVMQSLYCIDLFCQVLFVPSILLSHIWLICFVNNTYVDIAYLYKHLGGNMTGSVETGMFRPQQSVYQKWSLKGY